MQIRLKQLFGFLVLVSIALACVQQLPIISMIVLLLLLGGAYFFVPFSTWRISVVGTFAGIACYVMLFLFTILILAAPLDNPRTKGPNPHADFVNACIPFITCTAIPFGGMLGFISATFYVNLRGKFKKACELIDPFALLAAMIGAFVGPVVAYNTSISHVYTYGRMLVFDFGGQLDTVYLANDWSNEYPIESMRMFNVQLTNNYFAVSYPLAILVTAISIVAIVVLIWRQLLICRAENSSVVKDTEFQS